MGKRAAILTKKELTSLAKTYGATHGLKPNDAKAELALQAVADTDASDAEWTVLSYGMGVDSSAILLRLLKDGFEAHGINPERFLLLTAQTGNEYPDLGELVDTHIIPRLRKAGVRWVQVARQGRTKPRGGKNIVVLEDSTSPTRTYLEGRYTILDEMVEAATVPQSGGDRLCSIKAKGTALDAFIEEVVGNAPYRHIIGMESEELTRVYRDAHLGDANRRPTYLLVEWGWNRAKCLEFIKEETGASWVKSACVICPYAGQGKERESLLSRWAKYPELAGEALLMEHTALALNPTQKLFSSLSAKRFAEKNGLNDALASFERKKAEATWALYRVRRAWFPPKEGSDKGTVARSIRIEKSGTKEEIEDTLLREAVESGHGFENPNGIDRLVIHAKPADKVGREEALVASPKTMEKSKDGRKNFDALYESL